MMAWCGDGLGLLGHSGRTTGLLSNALTIRDSYSRLDRRDTALWIHRQDFDLDVDRSWPGAARVRDPRQALSELQCDTRHVIHHHDVMMLVTCLPVLGSMFM